MASNQVVVANVNAIICSDNAIAFEIDKEFSTKDTAQLIQNIALKVPYIHQRIIYVFLIKLLFNLVDRFMYKITI